MLIAVKFEFESAQARKVGSGLGLKLTFLQGLYVLFGREASGLIVVLSARFLLEFAASKRPL